MTVGATSDSPATAISASVMELAANFLCFKIAVYHSGVAVHVAPLNAQFTEPDWKRKVGFRTASQLTAPLCLNLAGAGIPPNVYTTSTITCVGSTDTRT